MLLHGSGVVGWFPPDTHPKLSGAARNEGGINEGTGETRRGEERLIGSVGHLYLEAEVGGESFLLPLIGCERCKRLS